MKLPLFPLHTVLCPGVALPLHIFEERYRQMIGRCMERGEPFGVVLILEGEEVGSFEGRIASVGTTALIREMSRYPDGRLRILTVGGRRFRIDGVDADGEPYLVGNVTLLDEPLGAAAEARRLADRVSRRFLAYLELLQSALGEETDGPEIEIELEVEPASGQLPDDDLGGQDEGVGIRAEALYDEAAPGLGGDAEGRQRRLDDAEKRELLMAAARRLASPADPTALSYVLTGLVQVALIRRQELLEANTTAERLAALDALLDRELFMLRLGLRPLHIDADDLKPRRN